MSTIRSCDFLKSGLTLWPDNIMTPCCLGMYGDFQNSRLVMPSTPNCFDMQAWKKLRATAHEELAQGSLPPECKKCPLLQEQKQDAAPEPFFSTINIINSRKCNIACNFCYLSKEFRKRDQSFDPHIGMFEDIVAQGLITTKTSIYWGGGEPALHPSIHELYTLFKKAGCRQHFDTNATIYMNFLESDLSLGKTVLSCSLMTSDPATYKKIMGRDVCSQVWENASRYAASGGDVRAKFVMLPENMGQEDAFIAKCKQLGISIINLDCEIFGIRNGNEDLLTIDRAAMFIHHAASQGIDLLHGVGITFCGEKFIKNIYARVAAIKQTMAEKYNAQTTHITLEVSSKNRHSKDTQVFFLEILSDVDPVSDMRTLQTREKDGWTTEKYSYFKQSYYKYTDKRAKKLSFITRHHKELKLRFICHAWSGIIKIRINNDKCYTIDLFSQTMQHLEFDVISGHTCMYNRVF